MQNRWLSAGLSFHSYAGVGVLSAALLAASITAIAQSPPVADVAVVIMRAGKITYAPASKLPPASTPAAKASGTTRATAKAIVTKSNELESFTRLRTGDTIDLAAEATVNIAYMATGLVEAWRGPAKLTVGRVKTNGGTKDPQAVQQLPEAMVARIARGPDALSELRNRTGAAIVKSLGTPTDDVPKARAERDAAVKADNKTATAVAAGHAADVSLAIAFIDAAQYADATTLLKAIAVKQPNDELVAELLKETSRLAKP